MERELVNDPKERAEHLMLIDLGRNDVGRVSSAGSVRISDVMTIERYSHVMHIVTNVRGHLARGKRPADVIRAAFPAGTLIEYQFSVVPLAKMSPSALRSEISPTLRPK